MISSDSGIASTDGSSHSARMRRVKQRDTPIELALRRELHRRGLRYRICAKDVPGRPDIVNRKRGVAVFIDGCFWHGCPRCYVAPRSNADFWQRKIAYNIGRREKVRAELRGLGFRVVELWGHEVEGNLRQVVARVERAFLLKGPLSRARPSGTLRRRKRA